MRSLRQRLRAIEPKQPVPLLAIAALTAVIVIFCGCGVPPEPLTLILTATSQICETTPAQEYGAARQWEDEDGNWQIERYSTGWDDVSETRVTWAISGGAPPYTLLIDGETRDADQAYAGASGTASVSCALGFSETFIDDNGQGRRYRTQPEVDSGLKTIRATATDSAGATADASVNVYVILELGGSGDILLSGKTYRVLGTLLTVPESVDHMSIGGFIEVDDGPGTLFGLSVGDNGWILVHLDDLTEVDRSTRSASAGDGDTAVGASERELDTQMDQVMDSVGRLPTVESAPP